MIYELVLGIYKLGIVAVILVALFVFFA